MGVYFVSVVVTLKDILDEKNNVVLVSSDLTPGYRRLPVEYIVWSTPK